MDIVKHAILKQAKLYFANAASKHIKLYVVFFDDEVVSQGFDSYTMLEAFVNENAVPGGDTGFYLPMQEILKNV